VTRILVAGGSGLLGAYLVAAGSRRGDVLSLSRRTRPSVDLADADAVRKALGNIRPDVVIHSAGFTDVDGCQRDPGTADRANHQSARSLAAATPPSASLVYISTDQVYPDTSGPHREEDAAPVNVYGRSKHAGELATAAHRNSLVLRTNLFGPSRTPGRESLSDEFASAFAAGRPMRLFTDVHFSPLHLSTLADMVFELVEKGVRGTLNLGSREGMSKRDFAHALAAQAGLSTASATDATSDAVAGRAPRAKDLRLNVERVEGALGRRMPSLREEIQRL